MENIQTLLYVPDEKDLQEDGVDLEELLEVILFRIDALESGLQEMWLDHNAMIRTLMMSGGRFNRDIFRTIKADLLKTMMESDNGVEGSTDKGS